MGFCTCIYPWTNHPNRTPTLGFVGKSKSVIKFMKTIVVIIGTGVFVLVLVVCPVIEKTPPPHTVEPSFPTQPVASSVMTFSGSYAPPVSGSCSLPVLGSYAAPAFYTYTGSWG